MLTDCVHGVGTDHTVRPVHVDTTGAFKGALVEGHELLSFAQSVFKSALQPLGGEVPAAGGAR